MSTSDKSMDMADMNLPEPEGRVMVIAGSDSSAGAGIQADLKTVSALGGYAMTAITALTAQNTEGVRQVHIPPTDMIIAQVQACLEDIGADVFKVGMLANQEIVSAVATLIDQYEDMPAIIDPVMVATSGDPLLDEAAIEAVKTELIPNAFLVTPNIKEAEVLTGRTIEDLDEQRQAGEDLLKMGAWAALIKGGHLDGPQVMDVLVTRNGMRLFSRTRHITKHTHGTGCSLASAIAACVAQGLPLDRAVEEGGDYVHEAIARAPKIGKGHGPIEHMWALKEAQKAAFLQGGGAGQEEGETNSPFAGLGDMMGSKPN